MLKSKTQHTSQFYAWAGITFEVLAIQHIQQIKHHLGIAGVATNTFSWRSKKNEDERGAQIDLVIERADNTINLCEMKFSESDFEITKDYDAALRNKIVRFRDETKTKKTIQLTFVTTYGIRKNMYSSTAQNDVKMEDLFENE